MYPLLEVKQVTKKFERNPLMAVNQVSFKLYPGDKLGVVGESGSGKSTLAKLIVRLDKVTAGQIFLAGQDITTIKGKALRELYQDIQLVFQSPKGSFNPRRTLGESIGESLSNQKYAKKEVACKVTELLQQCGLAAEFAQKYPHEVSGGQCQRAAIARALAPQPQLLICDEATSALDMTIQKQIMTLLENLSEQQQLSYLFISHDLALVQEFCNRLIVMKDGVIVETGITDEVIINPQHPYTKKLIEAVL